MDCAMNAKSRVRQEDLMARDIRTCILYGETFSTAGKGILSRLHAANGP